MIKRSRPPVRFELAPLLDVIFILLIFFAVSTTLLMEKNGIKLLLPQAEAVSKEKKGIELKIDQDQILFLEDKKIAMKTLKSSIKQLVIQEKKLQLTILADQKTPYVFVIEVMDKIRLAGCYDIILEAKKKR
tara:strand:+ start:536 stop:931 length:396 start_codon:yes stop_codon:yes gene_type:complete